VNHYLGQQPFCDGKHKGSEFKPLKFTLEDTVQSINLCGCKLTKTPPFCDEKICKNCVSEAPQKKEWEESTIFGLIGPVVFYFKISLKPFYAVN